ncbi:MATE family efflux transporter [uncultured Selenomonas sp.]|uniref:MATE family efflux transporter n=1 Tax=uncultured Selenomonas sp. TaxID=159275 RepID=UPI0025E961E7|nr:MATE family efflux transporter [uncultured Selenomonas sp.]
MSLSVMRFFVLVLGWTVDGVATATVLANGVSSLLLLRRLARMPGALRFRFALLRFDKKLLRDILRIGVPSGVQSSLFALANIVIQAAINSLGATVIAGAAAAYNLEVFAYYVMNAFNQTATTFVGQNYGAGQADRCKRTFALCLMEGYVLTAVACIAILYFSQPLIALFNPDSGISMLSAVIAVFWVHPAKNFARSHERKHF